MITQHQMFLEDKKKLDQLEHDAWMWALGSNVMEDPRERHYYRRLAKTADELAEPLRKRIIRRYL